ncbi:hypothetical protein [Novosphingobium lentum]|nr:hypothetical protein [Novosphingobium lentum]
MPRSSTLRSAPHRRRAIPPQPHPSWDRGPEPLDAGHAISPRDFWERLGI